MSGAWWCRTFGHRFQPRYTLGAATLPAEFAGHPVALVEVVERLRSKTYVRDVCTRCGARSDAPPADRLQAHSNSLDMALAPWRGHGTGAVFRSPPEPGAEPFAGYAGYVADGQAPASFYPPPGDPDADAPPWSPAGPGR